MAWLFLLAGGLTYLPGALLLGLLAALPVSRRMWLRTTHRAAMLVAVMFVAMAAIPAPLWLYGSGVVAVLAWLLVFGPARSVMRRRVLACSRLAVLLVALLAIALELPHEVLYRLPDAQNRHVFVIGDSLSAGIGDGVEPWPSILAAQHNIPVTNLAVAGARVDAGRRQVDALGEQGGAVVVLIGGNDLISGRAAEDFERDLDEVLKRAVQHQRTVAMFELPLPPNAAAYGRVQRDLARRYGVTLIPRRYLALLLARPTATTDGLHLTSPGQAAIADLVWRCIGGACECR